MQGQSSIKTRPPSYLFRYQQCQRARDKTKQMHQIKSGATCLTCLILRKNQPEPGIPQSPSQPRNRQHLSAAGEALFRVDRQKAQVVFSRMGEVFFVLRIFP